MSALAHKEGRSVSSQVLSSFLVAQHREVDDLLTLMAASCGTPAAADLFNHLRRALEHHIALEEKVLFPAFEQRGGPSGPIAVMRREHAVIRELLVPQASLLSDGAPCRARLAQLEAIMSQHNAKEEQVLYPMSDQLFADCAEDLLAAMTESAAIAN